MPDDPVPLFLNTTLDPFAYVNIKPWSFEYDPSTGSEQLNTVALIPF